MKQPDDMLSNYAEFIIGVVFSLTFRKVSEIPLIFFPYIVTSLQAESNLWLLSFEVT